ncbi:unnamed protein product [Calicophoron daubneyi]|uniref:poly(ADP-ribose) glycohydrolase n=1 Tax=Calicophoron daubneyi TaxID=300641 RepID=A0AAV2TNZ7_CALDB
MRAVNFFRQMDSSVNPVILPHNDKRWAEIKRIITRAAVCKLTIAELISQLDYVENLVNLNQPTRRRLFDLLPVRMTFLGLGNFIHMCLSEVEKEHFLQVTLPFVFHCATDIDLFTTPLTYCIQHHPYDSAICFPLVTSIIACCFLCLLPSHPTMSVLLNEANFTYFFRSITNASSIQAQKLRSLISYFEYCRNSGCQSSSLPNSIRIIRRLLSPESPASFTLQPETSELGSLEGLSDACIRALRTSPLPLLLVDEYNSSEAVADKLEIPMTYFVNAYVGGNVLHAGGVQEDSLFMRYPDLLVTLSMCQRLEEFEALWIDNYRGPFHPQLLTQHSDHRDEQSSKWRRLVIMNSSCFPSWASELQYSEACLISEILKATVAFFQVSQSDPQTSDVPTPFSAAWWNYRGRRRETTSSEHCAHSSWAYSAEAKVMLTERAARLCRYSDQLSRSVLQKAYENIVGLKNRTSLWAEMGLSRSLIPPPDIGFNPSAHSLVPSSPTKSYSSPLQSGFWSSGPHSQHHELLKDQTKKLISNASLQWSPSHSFRNMSLSSSSFSRSTDRSSFSRCRSVSTQSSFRRCSDLSSNSNSWLHRASLNREPSELLDLTEYEAKFELGSAIRPDNEASCLNDVPYHRDLYPVCEPTVAESSSFIQETGQRTTDSFLDLIASKERENEKSREYNPGDKAVAAAELYADYLLHELYEEVPPLAINRFNRLNEFAENFTYSVVNNGIRGAVWLEQWSSQLLVRAAEQIRDSNVSLPPEPISPTASSHRPVMRDERKCPNNHRRSRINLLDHFDPRQRGSLNNNTTTAILNWKRQCHLQNRWLSLASRQHHHRMSEHRTSFSSRPSFRHLGSSSSVDQSILRRSIHDQHKHSRLPSPHRKRGAYKLSSELMFGRSAPVPCSIKLFDLAPYPNPTTKVNVHLSDTLLRFAGGVATECCASALQKIRKVRYSSNGRPPGLVTSSWGKHTINPAADPQVKLMTQWIASAVVNPIKTKSASFSKLSEPMLDLSADLPPASYSEPQTPKTPLAAEHYVSPIVVCTHGDPRLKQLDFIVSLIYKTRCSAGNLLSLLLDYGAYRLVNGEQSDVSTVSNKHSPTLSLFEFLRRRLQPAFPGEKAAA